MQKGRQPKIAKMNADWLFWGVAKSWGLENWRQPWSYSIVKNTFGTPRNPTVSHVFAPGKMGGLEVEPICHPSPSYWTTWSLFRGEAWKPPTGQREWAKCRKAIFFGDFNWDIYARQGRLYIYIDKYIQDIYIYTSITTRIFPPGTRRSFSGTRSSEGLGASQEFQGFSTMAWL